MNQNEKNNEETNNSSSNGINPDIQGNNSVDKTIKMDTVDKTIVLDLPGQTMKMTIVDRTMKIDPFSNTATSLKDPEEIVNLKDYGLDDETQPKASASPKKVRHQKKLLDVDDVLLVSANNKKDKTESIRIEGDGCGEKDNYSFLISRYQLVKHFSQGKHTSLSLGKDTLFQRSVSIRTLSEKKLIDKEERDSFIKEAEVCAKLNHPSILPVYGIYSDYKGNLHTIHTFLNGKNLYQYLEQIVKNFRLKGFSLANESSSLYERIYYLINVLAGLEYAHKHNIIHCSLNPYRIYIGQYKEIYVAGWGMARNINDGIASSELSSALKNDVYAAPECSQPNQKVDHRADIYSLGMLLYEIVTLTPPYYGCTQDEIVQKKSNGESPVLEHRFNVQIDSDLKAIIQKAIAIDPEKRYQSVEELSKDLTRFLENEPISLRKQSFSKRYSKFIQKHQHFFFGTILSFIILLIFLLAFALVSQLHYTRKNEQTEQMANLQTSCIKLTNTMKSNLKQIDLMLNLSSLNLQQIFEHSISGSNKGKAELKNDTLFDKLHSSYLSSTGAYPDFEKFFHISAGEKDISLKQDELEFAVRTLFEKFMKIYQFIDVPSEQILQNNATIPASLYKIEIVLNSGEIFSYPSEKPNLLENESATWRKQAMEMKDSFFESVNFAPVKLQTKNPQNGNLISVHPVAIPLLNGQGEKIGAVVFLLNNSIFKMALKSSQNHDTGLEEQFVLSPEGEILYKREFKETRGNSFRREKTFEVFESLPEKFFSKEIFEKIKNNPTVGYEITKDEFKESVIYCWSSMEHQKWSFFYVEKISMRDFLDSLKTAKGNEVE